VVEEPEEPVLLHLEVLDMSGHLLVVLMPPVAEAQLVPLAAVQVVHHVLVVLAIVLQLITKVKHLLEVVEEEVLEEQGI
jgi:hypothetical protein